MNRNDKVKRSGVDGMGGAKVVAEIQEDLSKLMSRFNEQERGVSEFSVSELLNRTLRVIDAANDPQELNERLNELYSAYHDQEQYVSEFAMTALLNRVLGIYQQGMMAIMEEAEDGEVRDAEIKNLEEAKK